MASTLETLKQPSLYLKAIVGALIAGVGSLTSAVGDGGLTAYEWLTALGVLLVTFNAIFFTSNATQTQALDDKDESA